MFADYAKTLVRTHSLMGSIICNTLVNRVLQSYSVSNCLYNLYEVLDLFGPLYVKKYCRTMKRYIQQKPC